MTALPRRRALGHNRFMNAIRRHHHARLKHKRAGHFGGNASESRRKLGMVVATATPCSCPMCGNPRKYWGERTMQERRLFARMAD